MQNNSSKSNQINQSLEEIMSNCTQPDLDILDRTPQLLLKLSQAVKSISLQVQQLSKRPQYKPNPPIQQAPRSPAKQTERSNKNTESPSKKKQEEKQKLKGQQSNKKESVAGMVIDSRNWTDAAHVQYQNLVFDGDHIGNRGDGYTVVLGQRQISGKSYSYTVKFVNWKQQGTIGIHSKKQNKYIWYYSDATCFDGQEKKVKQGKGFGAGEAVTMLVDWGQGCASWVVGGEVRWRVQAQVLGNKELSWVPYLILWDKGDKVKLIGA